MFALIKKLYKDEEAFRAAVVWVAIAFIVGALFIQLAPAVKPFLFAMFFAALLNSGVNKLQKVGIPRYAGAAVLTIATVSILMLAVTLFYFAVHKHIISYSKDIKTAIEFLADWIPRALHKLSERIHLPIEIKTENIRDYLMSNLGDIAEKLGVYVLSIYDSAKSVVSVFSFMFLTPILTFYMLKDWPICIAKVRACLSNKALSFADFAIPQAKVALKHQMAGQLKVSLIVLVLYGAGLAGIGLAPVALLSTISAVLTFIPFIGIFVAFLITFAVAVTQGLSFAQIGGVAALYFIGSSIESNFLTPHFVGNKIGLHPLGIFFAVLSMSICVGLGGVIFVMPVATLIWSMIQSLSLWLKRERDKTAY
ncbi:MAG: AI-2E family transporter [Holosporales bacterium]|jgi:predicted PurR-regulated permease PerM|nr:AI-2E family transporter [Holosporales bacterium]